jgi:hypothetical protein
MDNDFDGVEDINDKCPNTSFLDTVDIDGCPNNRLYLGKISLEYEYQVQNSDNKSYINSYLIDVDYKKYLFSYFKSYIKIDSTSYTGDDYFSFGYMFNKVLYTNKTYIGIKKANNISELSTNEDDYFINTTFDYTFKQNILYSLFFQYTNTNETDYFTYNISSSYYIKNYQYIFDYTNSGSSNKTINKYQDIKLSFLYNFKNNFYTKLFYTKSLISSTNNLGFTIGYNFD